jgi:hypothetical protein
MVDKDEIVRLADEALSDDRDVALAAIRKLRQLLSNIESEHLRGKAEESSERGPAHGHRARRRNDV